MTTSNTDLNWLANYIWGIADDGLRDLYVRGKYRDVILPEVDPLAEDDLDSTIHDRENSNLGELDAEESAAEYTIAKEVTV